MLYRDQFLMVRYGIIVAISALIISMSPGCEKAGIQPRTYPYVITGLPQVDSGGALLRAELVQTGEEPIRGYGFVWADHNKPVVTDHCYLSEGNPKSGEYSYHVTSALAKGSFYYVRAYLKTDQLEVYGNEIAFECQGSNSPRIDSFTPLFGTPGIRVTICGDHFSTWIQEVVVKFGNITAIIDSLSENKIIAILPNVSEPAQVNITVEVAGMQAISGELFDIWFPWKRMNDFKETNVYMPGSFAIKDKGYIVLGDVSAGSLDLEWTNDLWEYDPQTDSWTPKTDFPGTPRGFEICFVIGDKAYIGLGGAYLSGGPYYSDLWEYDPETDSWDQKADFPGILCTSRVSFHINDKGYIGLGYYWNNAGYKEYVTDFWEYDPSKNSWIQRADFSGPARQDPFAFSIGSFGYIGNGMRSGHERSIYRYCPKEDTWTFIGEYPGTGKVGVNEFILNGKVYLGLGGTGYGGVCNDFWEFDPENNGWKGMRQCPVSMVAYLAFAIGDRGYIGMGGKLDKKTIYEFNPAKN